MNYYIDFDNTLFDTSKYTKDVLEILTKEILFKHDNLDFNDIFSECNSMFNREHFYNIYDLSKYFSEKYDLEHEKVLNKILSIFIDTSKYLYEDSLAFLKKLKSNNHHVFLLSYCKENLEHQTRKISGSGITNIFDVLYITSIPKYELDINYENGIFIDDNPSDLLGLASKNSLKIIRIKRFDNKYSNVEIQNEKIEEFSTLDSFCKSYLE